MIGRTWIKNAPEYAEKRKYIVVTVWKGDAWFWGAWDDKQAAMKAMENSDDDSLILMESEGHEHE